MTRTAILSAATALALVAGVTTGGVAQVTGERAEQDSSVTGQLNKCWGQVASQTAKLATPEGTNGGGMGQHSRSTQAANTNGGFASDDNAFGIQFNVDGGRQGIGNASADTDGFHREHPGDGGNGVHAINNGGQLSLLLNPVTGEGTPLNPVNPGNGEIVQMPCVP
jgi:hypothetical protein